MAIVYKVKKGDTLSKLGIPEEILKANPGLSKLSAGQVINLPSSGIPAGFQIDQNGLRSGGKPAQGVTSGTGYAPGGGGITYPSGTGIPGPGLGAGGQPPVGNNGTGLGSGGGWSAGGGGITYGPGGINRGGNDYGTNPTKFGNQPGGGGMMPGQQADPKVPQFVYSGGVIRRNPQSAISPGGGGINYSQTRNGTPINPLTGVAGPGLGAGGRPGGGTTALPPDGYGNQPGGGGINYGSGYGNQTKGGLDANGNKLQANGLSSDTSQWIDFQNPPPMTWEEYNARLIAARAAGYTGPAIREVNGQIVQGYWNPAAQGQYQNYQQNYQNQNYQQGQPQQPAQNTGGGNPSNSQMNWRF